MSINIYRSVPIITLLLYYHYSVCELTFEATGIASIIRWSTSYEQIAFAVNAISCDCCIALLVMRVFVVRFEVLQDLIANSIVADFNQGKVDLFEDRCVFSSHASIWQRGGLEPKKAPRAASRRVLGLWCVSYAPITVPPLGCRVCPVM